MAGIAFGNTITGRNNKDIYYAAALCSAVGATLADGSRLICKAGGVAWFVAPTSTQISSQWANGQYNSTFVGNKCCISEWGTLGSCLSANVRNYVETEWFVPSLPQLQNPGYVCRTNWGFTATCYWSSTGFPCGAYQFASRAYPVSFINGNQYNNQGKSATFAVRAFRCVTY
jgi:hypothetical protein